MSREPTRVLTYLLAVDAAALGWGVAALAGLRATRHDWVILAVLVGLALVYEEGVRRLGRLQFRVSGGAHREVTAVWLVAAAAALPGSLAVLLVVAVYTHLWLRKRRSAGEHVYRVVNRAAAALLGCLAAHAMLEWTASTWDGAGWLLADALAVLVVIVSFAVVHRGLLVGATALAGASGVRLLGTRDENLDEIATLCLAGLVALAALREPWLCALVLPPMVSLQRAALVRELEMAATLDPKTGLLNAVAWEELARRELARGRRTEKPVAVLILDIDRFKRVNDSFGHLVGDDLLREVGRCLEASVREFDTVGRFGGEEFVVVLPDAGDPEALVVAERLRVRIHELRVSGVAPGVDAERDVPMSVSIGVACAPTDGAELTDLLLAADGALYAAKARGRNCVVLAARGGGEFSRAAGS